MGGVITRRAVVVVLIAAAAAGAIAVNLILLGNASAQNAPVGKLNPAGKLVTTTHLAPAPSWTIRPTTGREHENDGRDD